MNNHSRLGSLLLPLSFAVPMLGAACTITTNNNVPAGDAGPTNDSPGGGGVLGFQPSNLGSVLDGLDLSTLVDLDVTTQGTYASLECGATSNNGCLTQSITQSDGSTAVAYIAKSWKVEPTVILGITDKTPVVLVALTTIDVLGGIDATADHNNPKGGGGFGTSTGDADGLGPGGGSKGDSSTTSSEGAIGGGGAGHCGAGGNGGRASAAVGVGGAPYGQASLVPLQGGSGGGNSLAGAGGGAFQLVAGTSITIRAGATVSAGGGGGYANTQGAAGAGAGGAILLEAPTVTIDGALSANGGGGGGGSAQGSSASGANATPDGTAAAGGIPGTLGAGGNGSASATTAGTDGANGDMPSGFGGTYGAAGGGGGAGWLRINTRSGAASITGTLSPAPTTSCATQGTLQ